MSAAREMDAGRELLDHQLIDVDGFFCGNVDDVELEIPDDGGLPVVVALLNGPEVLAKRLKGHVARGAGDLHRRLHPTLDGPARVPMRLVREIGSSVQLSARRDDLDGNRFEMWVRDHVISRIPAAKNAAE
jgi:sporulation protein YlmC with PRC-barrel domain